MAWECDVQVNSRTASAAAQSAVARLGKGKAALALELVGYDNDLGAAMKYAFGNAFVCKARTPIPSDVIRDCSHAFTCRWHHLLCTASAPRFQEYQEYLR